jgi:hypothetical protein
MCRSIKTLRGVEPAASEEEIRAAALQFVRKISGYRQPSSLNQAVFDAAVDEITASSRRLLDGLQLRRAPLPKSVIGAQRMPAQDSA